MNYIFGNKYSTSITPLLNLIIIYGSLTHYWDSSCHRVDSDDTKMNKAPELKTNKQTTIAHSLTWTNAMIDIRTQGYKQNVSNTVYIECGGTIQYIKVKFSGRTEASSRRQHPRKVIKEGEWDKEKYSHKSLQGCVWEIKTALYHWIVTLGE